MLLLLLTSLTGLASEEAQPAHMLELSPARTIEATETCTVRNPNLRATEWIFMAARPPDLPGQTKGSVTISPGQTRSVKELSPLKRPIIEARIPVKDKRFQNEITVVVQYRAELMSRKLIAAPKGVKVKPVAPLSAAQRKLFLASTSFFDHDSEAARKWVQQHLRRGEKEGDVVFARRVFDYICKSYRYKYEAKQDRHVSHLCTQEATDCGGQSVQFVSALRANGIPSRSLVGRMAESAKKKGKANNLQTHVRAEFYAEGIGWVPVDPAKGWFGRDPGDFLVLHVDYDLVYDLRPLGKQTVTLAQLVAFWSIGSGSLAGSTTTNDWKVITRGR